MNRIEVSSARIHGIAAPPPSKSAAHRALICAALAGGGSVRGVSRSDDMCATMGAIRAFGVSTRQDGHTVTVLSRRRNTAEEQPVMVDCMESGSTLRFLIPLFAARGIPCVFTGSGRLPQRPLGIYADCLPRHGMTLRSQGGLPLEIEGRLSAGRYELPGDVSSQFVSGLLFALPLCEGDSEIVLTTPLESAAYVDMTIDAIHQAGVLIEPTVFGWRIPGGQIYRAHDYMVEGDWSQAAFLLAMGALGGELWVTGMNPDSHQGDRAALELLRRFGAELTQTADGFISRQSVLTGISIDASQIPDLVPVLAVVGALAQGVTTITGAARLRLKESDRLAAVTHCLNRLGGRVEETADGLCIEGVGRLHGGVSVPGFHDHRIVMSMAVAALRCEEPVIIEDADSVAKSWPDFFEEYRNCGGEAHVL